MKEIKFNTSKGEFLFFDKNDVPIMFSLYLDNIKQKHEVLDIIIYKLSEITEEKASEIVDEDNEYGARLYQNYQTTSMQYFDEQITAIESLHSLLKSKGIHLFENPVKFPEYLDGYTDEYLDCVIAEFNSEESKTFYNPYIFKL